MLVLWYGSSSGLWAVLGSGRPLVDRFVRNYYTLQETLMELALFLNYFFGWLNAFSTEQLWLKHLHHITDSMLERSDARIRKITKKSYFKLSGFRSHSQRTLAGRVCWGVFWAELVRHGQTLSLLVTNMLKLRFDKDFQSQLFLILFTRSTMTKGRPHPSMADLSIIGLCAFLTLWRSGDIEGLIQAQSTAGWTSFPSSIVTFFSSPFSSQ